MCKGSCSTNPTRVSEHEACTLTTAASLRVEQVFTDCVKYRILHLKSWCRIFAVAVSLLNVFFPLDACPYIYLSLLRPCSSMLWTLCTKMSMTFPRQSLHLCHKVGQSCAEMRWRSGLLQRQTSLRKH